MKHITLLAIPLILSIICLGQKKDDRTIIIQMADSSQVYESLRLALVKNDYVIKEYSTRDTLITYPTEMSTMPGYTVILAVINGNSIQLTGSYSQKKMNYFGYSTSSKDYIPIRYYHGSKTWRAMNKVAETIENKSTITYTE